MTGKNANDTSNTSTQPGTGAPPGLDSASNACAAPAPDALPVSISRSYFAAAKNSARTAFASLRVSMRWEWGRSRGRS